MTSSVPIPIASLPATAQVFAEIIGVEKTIDLAQIAKHREVYIPKHIPQGHWLHEQLGASLSKRLSDELGGTKLTLARCSALKRKERDKDIKREFRNGHTNISFLASDYNLTAKRVSQIIAR